MQLTSLKLILENASVPIAELIPKRVGNAPLAVVLSVKSAKTPAPIDSTTLKAPLSVILLHPPQVRLAKLTSQPPLL